MSYEKTHYVSSDENKPTIVKPGTYFCYQCTFRLEVFYREIPLRPCPKCEGRAFVST